MKSASAPTAERSNQLERVFGSHPVVVESASRAPVGDLVSGNERPVNVFTSRTSGAYRSVITGGDNKASNTPKFLLRSTITLRR